MPFDGTNFEWNDDVLCRLRIGREKIVAGWSQKTIWSANGSVCAIGAVLAPEKVFAFGIPLYWRSWTDGAVWALRHALPNGWHSIVAFNDHRWTTKFDVLQLFDRAIEARIAKLVLTCSPKLQPVGGRVRTEWGRTDERSRYTEEQIVLGQIVGRFDGGDRADPDSLSAPVATRPAAPVQTKV